MSLMVALTLCLWGAASVLPARAQDADNTDAVTADTNKDVPIDARTEGMKDYPVVKLQSLDKSTARTMTFEVRVGSTVKFGPLYIKVDACRKSSPLESPESASFLQIWEVTKDQQAHWIFSGWMFASSPALSAMDHPLYDVWVLDCLEKKTGKGDQVEEEHVDKPAGGDAPVSKDKKAADSKKADDIESEPLAPQDNQAD